MIVVDTNVIACLLFPGEQSASAEQVLELDFAWAAPLLWRSEFLNVLAVGVRAGRFDVASAVAALARATRLVEGREFAVAAPSVLETALETGLTAYDSEFVVLARDLNTRLATLDREILDVASDVAVEPGHLG